jgi:hypothetical protein
VKAQSKAPTSGFSSVVMSEHTAHKTDLRFILPYDGCTIEGISSSFSSSYIALGHNPFNGGLYVFPNRAHNKIKCCMWEDNDFVLAGKGTDLERHSQTIHN